MITKYKCNHFVKFKNRIDTSYKETSERIVFVKIFNNDLNPVSGNGMILLKQIQEIIKIKLLFMFVGLIKFLVYFLYYVICYHDRIKMLYP